jgi:hypothetical protein
METLQAVLNADNRRVIYALAEWIQQQINEQWEAVFQAHHAAMVAAYPELGDGVYGIYGEALFKPIRAEMKQAGFKTTPRLPFGSFSISREWGPEANRERWFWSKITGVDGAAIGTIAVVFYHDHEAIRIPGPCKIIALEETTKGAVIAALSQRVPEFATAVEAKIEIAAYLASLEAGQSQI